MRKASVPNFVEIICQECGKKGVARSTQAKYCYECGDIVRARKVRENRLRRQRQAISRYRVEQALKEEQVSGDTHSAAFNSIEIKHRNKLKAELRKELLEN